MGEVSGIFESKPPVQASRPAAPPYKQIISERLSEVFASSVAPKDVQISEARPARLPSGSVWRVCVRASLTGITGRETGPLTYVVFLSRDRIEDRRLAVADDQCQQETFERL
jgi:hypothetical protein